jgi:hypothetical protein
VKPGAQKNKLKSLWARYKVKIVVFVIILCFVLKGIYDAVIQEDKDHRDRQKIVALTKTFEE